MLDKYLPCIVSFSPPWQYFFRSLTLLILFDLCSILQCDYFWLVMSLSFSGLRFNFCGETCLKDLPWVSRRPAFKSHPLRHGFYLLSLPLSSVINFSNNLHTTNNGKINILLLLLYFHLFHLFSRAAETKSSFV